MKSCVKENMPYAKTQDRQQTKGASEMKVEQAREVDATVGQRLVEEGNWDWWKIYGLERKEGNAESKQNPYEM